MAQTIDKGLALVSVADVLFFNASTGAYMGEGLALTNSTIESAIDSIEQRGGYLNALLYDIKYNKTMNVSLESATFKMEYLAFQTGTPIVTGLSGVYKFDECVTFTNGIGEVADTPVGNVWVRLPNGAVTEIVPSGKSVDTGLSTFSGTLQVIYQYNASVEQITMDTKSQPLTVKAVMRVHTTNQDGVEGYIEITIPRLKFDGNITFDLTSDGVSTTNMSGTAQEFTTGCGEGYYATVKYYSMAEEAIIPVTNIVASPNVLSLSMAGVKEATANIIGVRNAPYSNVSLDNTKLTFNSSADDTVEVAPDGKMTAKKTGSAEITVSYEGLQDVIKVTVGA